MRLLFLFIIFFLLAFISWSQVKMDITLTNGDVRTGIFRVKDNTLGYATKTKIISQKTKQKYRLKDIRSLVMYVDDDMVKYETIRVKKYFDSSKTEYKLGQVGLKGKRIELFYVSEYIYQGGAVSNTTTASSYHEKYLRKKNDLVAYNMGYLYGAGQRGIKKRLKDFFRDCPVLIDKVENKEIPKKETMEIAMFYENKCGE